MTFQDIDSMIRTDPAILQDAAEKRRRLRAWMQAAGYQGVIISRRDNFAWLTSGGDNRVLNNTENGFAHALITLDKAYLFAHVMDAARVSEEQIPGQEFELITMHWHEGDPRQRALTLVSGPAAADTFLPGIPDINSELSILHYPLTAIELDRCRWLGKTVNRLLEEAAAAIQPGETEIEIARRLHCAHIECGIDLDVLIVGSDERISKYRHALPTHKKVERYLILHPAARRWGLHANVTRSLHFGTPPDEIRRAYNVAAAVEARILAMLPRYPPFARIFEHQKNWYAQLGMPGEWENHFQGGLTGYVVSDALRCQTETSVAPGQAFDWFITVTGAKVEELALLTEQGVELASATGTWPMVQIQTNHGIISVPDIMVR